LVRFDPVPEYRRAPDLRPFLHAPSEEQTLTPIRHVLCPIDFSDASRHAIEQAVAIARWYRARLTALHVYSPIFVPVPGLPAPEDRVPETEVERVNRRATTFVEAASSADVRFDVRISVGQPAAQILSQAAALPVDVIVMGTHGASGFKHVVLGSVAEKVLRQATCPVLTVPPRAHATSQFPFTRILCAVDFSEWSCAAVAQAASLAQESGAALDLLHVIEWPWVEPPPPAAAELPAAQAAALAEFRRYLVKTATDRLESEVPETMRGRPGVTVRVSHGKPYVEILRTAADDGVDLIVLGVHGRNPIDLALFGSTTNQVVRYARCPVLTVRGEVSAPRNKTAPTS
jgi:nucleotide-binding universal stress UspA family protein